MNPEIRELIMRQNVKYNDHLNFNFLNEFFFRSALKPQIHLISFWVE